MPFEDDVSSDESSSSTEILDEVSAAQVSVSSPTPSQQSAWGLSKSDEVQFLHNIDTAGGFDIVRLDKLFKTDHSFYLSSENTKKQFRNQFNYWKKLDKEGKFSSVRSELQLLSSDFQTAGGRKRVQINKKTATAGFQTPRRPILLTQKN